MIPQEKILPPMTLVGLEAETTQENLSTASLGLWKKAGELELDVNIRNLKEPHVTLECQFDWHETERWTFMLAMEVVSVEGVPSEAVVRRIPEASWLVFDLPGEVPDIKVAEAWVEMIEWFTASQRTLPSLSYIQRYDDHSKKAQNLIQLEV